jgi:transcriptional regulator with XRE-family HTH domain
MLMNAPADAPPPHPPSKLKARRLLLGLSQRSVALASKGRLTRDGLSRFETGDAWPNPFQMQALADVYACSRETICEEAMQSWLSRSERP